jgi:hypothetical protein
VNRNIHPVLAMGIILLVAAIWVVVWFHFTRPEPPAVAPQLAPSAPPGAERAGDRERMGTRGVEGGQALPTARGVLTDAEEVGAASE